MIIRDDKNHISGSHINIMLFRFVETLSSTIGQRVQQIAIDTTKPKTALAAPHIPSEYFSLNCTTLALKPEAALVSSL